MPAVQLRHGIFMGPYHPLNENPTAALHRDLRLMEWLDEHGYDEAWIGEHHSGGYEIISSPEIFIAAAAERTKRLRFGTGVVSLSYHHPLNVANRIVQLDHQTRGRVMLGCGPGLLVGDASMLGIEPDAIRDRMGQSLNAILRLLRGEIVTETTDWYSLVNARTHLQPYTYPHPEVAVASAVSPSSARLAGMHDLGILCVAATDSGYDALGNNWRVACETAAQQGRTMDPSRIRVVGPIHIAETREKARENVRFGLEHYIKYFQALGPERWSVPAGKDPVDWINESGRGAIGTPDDAIALLDRLYRQLGEIGAFLHQANNWADWEQTKKSYELYTRFVMPHFAKSNLSRQASFDWTLSNRTEFSGKRQAAVDAAFAKHTAATGVDLRPAKTGAGSKPVSW